MVRDHLRARLEEDELEVIAKNINLPVGELIVNGKLDPFKVVDIDTVLISSRHLCRMAYSQNEK